MLRLIGVVVSIGLADSANPTTIGPALYLAAGERGRGRVAAFTVAVFAVYLLGGTAIALGPGRLIFAAFRPHHEVTHIVEIVVGAMMIALAAILWSRRDRLSSSGPPRTTPDGRSSAILGATITAVELPTAFPYFGAITAIVGSGFDAGRQLVLLVLFNVCFVLPLVGIVAMLAVSGESGNTILLRWRDRLHEHWPAVLAALVLLAGTIVVLLGVTGLSAHTGFSKFIRGRLLRHIG